MLLPRVLRPCALSRLRGIVCCSTQPFGGSRNVPLKEIEAANEDLRWHFLVDDSQQASDQGQGSSGSGSAPLLKHSSGPPSTSSFTPHTSMPFTHAEQAAEKCEPSSRSSRSSSEVHGQSQDGKLTHVDGSGRAHMVDVSQKPSSVRTAVATASVWYNRQVPEHTRLLQRSAAFGLGGTGQSVTQVSPWASEQGAQRMLSAQLAGIRAAKMTSWLIPLCHNINLSKVNVQLDPHPERGEVQVTASATAVGQTGVEMEALAAAAFGALNLLGDSEGNSQWAGVGRVTSVRLESKTGGKSGDYSRLSESSAGALNTSFAQPSSLDGPNTQPSTSTPPIAAPRAGRPAFGLPAAYARLTLPPATWSQLVENVNKKGDVLAVAKLAGMMAADQAAALLPSAVGGLSASQVEVELDASQEGQVHVWAHAGASIGDGLHKRVITAAAVSALTVYDMCKASSKSIVIDEIGLVPIA